MIRKAIFNKKMGFLKYWDSKNTEVTINCSDIKTAKAIIKGTHYEQELIKE